MKHKDINNAQRRTTGNRVPSNLGISSAIDLESAIPFFKQYNVEKVAVFGSYARGEHKFDSDIDLLISFTEKYDLFDIIGLKQDLEEVLMRSVDLLTYESLQNDTFAETILAEAKLVYEKN